MIHRKSVIAGFRRHCGTIFATILHVLKRDMQRSFIVLLILILTNFSALAQRIRVLTASGREPIENVAIFNNTREKAVITDSLGYTDIAVFLGEDTVVFQHPSYNQSIFSWDELSEMKLVHLSRKNILIDEFVILALKS